MRVRNSLLQLVGLKTNTCRYLPVSADEPGPFCQLRGKSLDNAEV